MLLPANASDPANMTAQIISIYKNLIGKRSGNGLMDSSKGGSVDHGRIEASSVEYGDESSLATEPADEDHVGEPVFSLQRTKKDNK